jgi:hypothetical protein
MADRFPSLDEIDAGQTTTRGGGGGDDLIGDSSAGDDFLARERAALGDDANLFATPGDNAATVEDAEDEGDLLGGGGSGGGNYGGGDFGEFENDFPSINTTNEHMAPGGTITGTAAPFLPGAPTSAYGEPEEDEPEVLKEWRERRDLAIQHRDEVSAGRKEQTIKAAQEAIDEFYENYNNKKEKNVAQTRREAEEFLAKREDTSAGGTSWERIAKLVDLSGKGARGGAGGSGKERFREVLISLRKDEKAPGATGY